MYIFFISVFGAENGWWCFWCVCDKCGIWCRLYDRLIVVWSRLLLIWFLVNSFACVFVRSRRLTTDLFSIGSWPMLILAARMWKQVVVEGHW
jgi:hypothetical protein